MKEAIGKMTHAIDEIMDGNVYGVWLYGSVALDDFRLGWSDIDFVALTDGPISQNQAERLVFLRQAMLQRETHNPYYRSFEGVIAARGEYGRQSFQRLVYWGTRGQRVTDRYASDAFSGLELAKCGKSAYGKEPWILPAPGREEVIKAIRAHLDTIRTCAVQTDESLYSCGWLLDIARCVYTLRHNDIIAKTQAGVWALEEHVFPEEAVLRKTLEIRQHPLSFRGREGLAQWLKGLGPVVQRCADVLERELQAAI